MIFLSNPTDGDGVSFPAEGSAGSVQYNSADVIAGAEKVAIKDGELMIHESLSSLAPLAGAVKLIGKTYGPVGGRTMLATIGPSGMSHALQPSIWRQSIAMWKPPGNSTTAPGVFGMNALSASGTATTRSVATTNALTRAKRVGYVSSTTAGNVAGHRSTVAQHTLGTGTVGGFFYSCRFGVSDAVLRSEARTFVGMTSSTAAPTNVDPGTLTNCIGIGHTASDTNWFIYFGGSSPQTRIDLGANFPINKTDIIEITLFSPTNINGVCDYYVERITATGEYSASGYVGPGTAGVTIPNSNTLLAHRAWRTNNTAAAAIGIDIISVYIETDW